MKSSLVYFISKSKKILYVNFENERLSIKESELNKVYCIDNGIITALSFKLSQNKGKLMKNLVAIELLRRKFYFHPDYEIYYWKDYQKREKADKEFKSEKMLIITWDSEEEIKINGKVIELIPLWK